jgi:hypothetical protein
MLPLSCLPQLTAHILCLLAIHYALQVRWCNPPNVGLQLQHYLLWCGSFWQALLNTGDAAAALPAELELAQLAASALAEYPAASLLGQD